MVFVRLFAFMILRDLWISLSWPRELIRNKDLLMGFFLRPFRVFGELITIKFSIAKVAIEIGGSDVVFLHVIVYSKVLFLRSSFLLVFIF